MSGDAHIPGAKSGVDGTATGVPWRVLGRVAWLQIVGYRDFDDVACIA